MNANELADALDDDWADKFRFDAATMLRQQQAEIEALKEKVKQNADLEEKVDLCKEKLKPIVWMSEVEGGTMYTNYEYPESVPLYTHPVKDLCKAELTDEEIMHMAKDYCHYTEYRLAIQFARAILRKVSEK